MDVKTIKRELYEIGKKRPMLLGLMKKGIEIGYDKTEQLGRGTVGHEWATTMTDLDERHFGDVCDDYVRFRKTLPDPMEELPYEIRQAVLRRMEKDEQRLRSHEAAIERKRIKAERVRAVIPIGELIKAEPDSLTKRSNNG